MGITVRNLNIGGRIIGKDFIPAPPATPAYITTNLMLNVDASNPLSYPGTGTTWTDISSSVNNMSLVNEPTYSSNNGGYIYFDGINDYAATSNGIPIGTGTSRTIEVVFRRRGPDNTLLSHNRTGGHGFIILYGGAFGVSWISSNGWPYSYYISHSATINQDQWYHGIFSSNFPGSTGTWTASVGVNGVFENPSTYAVVDTPALNYNIELSRHINSFWSSAIASFDIALVRIYSVALTQEQMTQNYNSVKSRYGL